MMATDYKTNNLDWESAVQQWDNEIQHRASRRQTGHDYSQQGVRRRKAEGLRKFDESKTTFKRGETDTTGSPHPTQPRPLPQPYKSPHHSQPKSTFEQRKVDAKESPCSTQSWLSPQPCESNQPPMWLTQTMLDDMINKLLEQLENINHKLSISTNKEEGERLLQSVKEEEQERLLREIEQVEKETRPRSMEQEARLAQVQKLSELLAAVVNRIQELIALSKYKGTEDFSSGEKKFYVAGSVYGTVVEALPDTGADTSFISPDLASRFGLRPIPETQKRVTLANKKAVKSPGMVKLPWKFTKERTTHTINCWILPGCLRHLVLGNPFLQATQTLTKFRDRIKSKLLATPKFLSLSVLGEEKQRVRGYLNGQLAAALPDTGSDAMLINGAYARKTGLSIDSNVENQVKVRLADGSTTMTSGIVRDVDWKVGSTTVRCSFYVLENMCVDVILSNNYLFEMDIFSKEKEHFFHVNSENYSKDHLLYFCVLRLIKKKKPDPILTLEEKEEQEKQEEWHIRDTKRDEIMALPEGQREAADRAEKARQQRWVELRSEREARWIAESRVMTESVQNSVSWGGRWRKWAYINLLTKA